MPYLDKRGRTCGFLNIEEKENSGRFSRRYFILNIKDGKFQYFMDNPHNLHHNDRRPVGEISLQFISKVSDARKMRPKVDSCFVVSYAGNSLFLQADDSEDMTKWIEAMNDASRITVPCQENKSTAKHEWHQPGVTEQAFKTEIAGGVVCKIPMQTSDDESSHSSDSEFDSSGMAACMLQSVKAGYCVKQGGMRKNWKRRYFVLNEQGILYFSSEKAKEPLRHIPRCDIQNVRKATSGPLRRDNLFEIITPKRTFYIQCDNPDSMYDWIDAISKTLSLNTDQTQTQAKQSAATTTKYSQSDMDNFPVTKVYPHGDWCSSDESKSVDTAESTRQRKRSWLLW